MTSPEDSQPASPTHSKMIAAAKAGPSATCVAIVHHVFPTSDIWPAAIQILAATALTKVEDILPEEAMAIGGAIIWFSATCTHNSPSVSSVWTMVPEEHAGMAPTLKHFKSDQMPPSTHVWPGLSIAPAMQAIIVNRVSVVDPELAAIIRDNAKIVMTCPEDSQAACPSHCKVVASSEPRPFATCVAVVHHMAPTGHVCSASIKVLTAAALAKVENVLPKETSAIGGRSPSGTLSSASRLHNEPSVSSVWTMVPE
jgi:hypothetical protein